MKKLFYYWLLATGLVACQTSAPNSEKSAGQKIKSSVDYQNVQVFQTVRNSDDRITQKKTVNFENFAQPLETQACVFIDPLHHFQTFIGIGGAFTDASAEVFAQLSAARQQEFLTACFDPDKGNGYTLGRTTIASSDFSSSSYDYVAENDTSLSSFSVAHDEKYKIPLIRRALKVSGDRLNLFASPWSPPAWMKTNHSRLHGGHLLPSCRKAWAQHFVKFVQAYRKEGIDLWGLTVQNEPMASQIWESCIYTADEERDFVKNDLGPALWNAGLKSVKLIMWDHNRDLIFQRASVLLNDSDAARYIWGIGFHWYETWTGSSMQFDNLQRVKEAFPEKHLIFTEGCVEKFSAENLQTWHLGERYAHSMIHDFNEGTEAWCDWNLLLNDQGGPNHVGNYCFAPVHANLKKDSLIYTNSYYYIGQFSRFIKPGARRISASSNRDILQTTAFENSDGSIAVVVLNTTDQPLDYHLWLAGKGAALNSPAHSLMTLLLQP